MDAQTLAALSSTALQQAADIERLVQEVQENIRTANLYAGQMPTPAVYWVAGPEEFAAKV